MEAFSLPLQREARTLHDAGQVFPNQLPAGQEPDPDKADDAVDFDGNAVPPAKQTNRGRPGSKNKPKAAAQTASASAESADAKASAAQPKKRGRPARSNKKVKPGQSTAGRGRDRARPERNMQQIYLDASDADNATSGNNRSGQAEQSDVASLASSDLSSSQPDSHVSISDCSTVHSSGLDSDLASLSDASGEDSIVTEEAVVPEDTGIDDFEKCNSDE